MMDLEQLANDMVDFSKNYDYYEFVDTVDNEEEEYQKQLRDLQDFKSVKNTIKHLNIVFDDINDDLRETLFNNYVLEDGYGELKLIAELKDNYKKLESIINRLYKCEKSFNYEEVNEENVLDFFEENHNFDYDSEYVDRLKDFVDKKEMMKALVDDFDLTEIDGKYYYDSNDNSKELDEREV